jgi:signal transduction histidine kinase
VEDYCLSEAEVRKLAEEIDYPKPEELVRLHKEMVVTNATELKGRAEGLAEIAGPIEDSASIAFLRRKRMQYDRLTVAVLNRLRAALSSANIRSAATVQKEIYLSIGPALKELTDSIGSCFSAICEVPVNGEGGKGSVIRVVAYTGLYKRQPTKSIKVDRKECEEIFRQLDRCDEPQQLSISALDWKLFGKLKRAIQIDNIDHAIIAQIPSLENKILWVTLLCNNCDVLISSGALLEDFTKMLATLSQNITQIINVEYLVAQQQDTVRDLGEKKKELERKGEESRLLLRSIAHQVSRPIMELKQSAFIISHQGFSIEAYNGFRACLMELERGSKNFNLYEVLTTDVDKRVEELRKRDSISVEELVEKGKERIKPYLMVDRRELDVFENIQKGLTMPNAVGNMESTLECLVNVLHNAIKYSIGSRPIEVETTYRLGSGWIEIRVSNWGIELPEEDWERVFDEVFRSDTAKVVAIRRRGDSQGV